MPSPDDPEHADLIRDIGDLLKQQGFLVEPFAHYEYLSQPMKEAIGHSYSPTSMGVRAEADLLAAHEHHDFVFKCEAKTHGEACRYDNFAFEFGPLCIHLSQHISFREKCLYVCRDCKTNEDFGFWATREETPRPKRIIFPRAVKNLALLDSYKRKAQRLFPEVEIREMGSTGGSDDPFALVSMEDMRQLPNWIRLVRKEIANDRADNVF